MLDWLPHLSMLFPEAVELAIQMPQTPLDRNSIIHEISKGDLWEKYPEATAKLLVHVADSESPGWAWHGGKGTHRQAPSTQSFRMTSEQS